MPGEITEDGLFASRAFLFSETNTRIVRITLSGLLSPCFDRFLTRIQQYARLDNRGAENQAFVHFKTYFTWFSLTCRQLGASIFCPQFGSFFCPDMGSAVSAAVLLDTATSPGDLSSGTCLQISERQKEIRR